MKEETTASEKSLGPKGSIDCPEQLKRFNRCLETKSIFTGTHQRLSTKLDGH
jgi:hypothetical protein